MKRTDTDGDGSISKDELNAAPQQQRDRLLKADSNGDGSVDRGELMKGLAQPRGGGS